MPARPVPPPDPLIKAGIAVKRDTKAHPIFSDLELKAIEEALHRTQVDGGRSALDKVQEARLAR